ncbi:Fis family transcriptional regulator [Planotetraspora silvatica]|uniref:Fis family transcriptional regulator n=1 Tax=Planotetraspora silvatica TaxID=234614 RepID=A0A8J3USH5_9ACTN|nr:helix-turn-helix domain-containing protein [Planotetraspora silvatica]GII50507.1 Fis family transcriptional regulator [Planotetraspora silvatica]
MAYSEDSAESVTRAREHFLETGVVPSIPLRPGIADSWRRCSLAGMGCDDLDPPYFDDLDTEGRLMHAAQPVLDGLEETLSDATMSVILTDTQGRLLDRRVSDGALRRHLDRIRFAPGFSYAEEHVGTNGIGTALETQQLAVVAGGEHFTSPLHALACAGAPINDRLTGRLAGLLDITSWSTRVSPLMPALARSAAGAIERRLLELASERERTLLEAFMAAERHGGQAIITVADDLTMVNRRAADLLGRSDHAIVRDMVAEILRAGGEHTASVVLSRGEPATIHCRPIEANRGAVVEISVTGRRGSPARPRVGPADLKLAGTSALFANVCADLAMLRQAGTWLLLEGEPGVGKLALARAVHYRSAPDRLFAVIESTEDVAGRCSATPGAPGGTVVLRHVERFTDNARAAVVDWLDNVAEGANRVWVVATTEIGSELPDNLLSRLPATLTVPPLRHRIEDVRELVPALLGTSSLGRSVSCGPAAMRALLRSTWPGNVAELAHALRHALARRRVGQIQPEDLPESCHVTGGRVLSRWEAIERDAIIRALLETDDDKAAAADLLGISRATIYRKINVYGINIETGPPVSK